MPRKFSLPARPQLGSWKDPQFRFRVILGILVGLNLVAAAFAFHLFDDSPEKLAQQELATRQQTVAESKALRDLRATAAKVNRGQSQSQQFVDTYMTSRRVTYSSIISELNQTALDAGMKRKDAVIGLDAIQGTDSLDVMTITASFEGDYKNLVKFVNLLDRSKRFLLIESMTATPQLNKTLQVTVKLNTFVKDDRPNT